MKKFKAFFLKKSIKMLIKDIEIICPKVYPNEEYSPAEVFGSMVWLWSLFDYYGDSALNEASEIILSTIRSKNFAIFFRDKQPIGYVNWAWLDAETEQKYKLKALSYSELISHQESGNNKHLWILSWFCLSEKHNHFTMYRLLNKYIFKNERVYFTYHKSRENLARFYSKQC